MADAQASGACSRKAVWVQVPSPASQGLWSEPKAFLFARTDENRSGRGFSSEVFGRFADSGMSVSDSRSAPAIQQSGKSRTPS